MTKIEVLRNFYSALNRNDIPAALQCFHSQIMRIEWEGTPSQGIFNGLTELENHLRSGRDSWAEGSCEPEEFLDFPQKMLVKAHVRVRLKDRSEWNEGIVSDVYAFQDEKIIVFRSYLDHQQALDWAQSKLF